MLNVDRFRVSILHYLIWKTYQTDNVTSTTRVTHRTGMLKERNLVAARECFGEPLVKATKVIGASCAGLAENRKASTEGSTAVVKRNIKRDTGV